MTTSKIILFPQKNPLQQGDLVKIIQCEDFPQEIGRTGKITFDRGKYCDALGVSYRGKTARYEVQLDKSEQSTLCLASFFPWELERIQ